MWKNNCYQWASYKEGLNFLSAVHTRKYALLLNSPQEALLILDSRSYDLPVDVFDAGEVRPTRPKKRAVKTADGTKKVDSVIGKRRTDSSENEVCVPNHWMTAVLCVVAPQVVSATCFEVKLIKGSNGQ